MSKVGRAHTRTRGGNGLQETLREMKRQAAVAGAVLMPAFETFAVIAEQQRAGRQQRVALRRATTEGSRGHDRDAGRLALFLERLVLWTRGADEIVDLPARPGREKL